MIKFTFSALFLLLLSLAQAETLNAIALKNGCRLIQKPSAFYTSSMHTAKIDDWTVQGLMDQNSVTGWCSGAASKAPYIFVFELSEEYVLNQLRFNNLCPKQYPGICSKDVAVEYSMTSASSGFTTIGNYSLAQYTTTAVDIAPVKARWIKLIVSSNYGNAQWTELMEFEAIGTFLYQNASTQNIDGLWNSNFDWISIKKNTFGYQYGCYKWAQGELFNSKANRRVFRFDWKQKGGGQTGWCVLVLNKEGTHMNGIWGIGKDTAQFGSLELTKSQVQPYPCPNDEELKTLKPGVIASPIQEVIVELVIDVMEEHSKKHIAGTLELFTQEKQYALSSPDGIYTINIPESRYLIVKTSLPNYFPSVDTLFLEDEAGAKYINMPVYVTKLAIGSNIVLKNILFNKGSFDLLPASKADLEMIHTTLYKYPTMEIELSGHTDNQGDAKKNIELSEQRVKAVKEYLVMRGINALRIKGVGYGGRYPIVSNASEKTRKLNRRVELKILKM